MFCGCAGDTVAAKRCAYKNGGDQPDGTYDQCGATSFLSLILIYLIYYNFGLRQHDEKHNIDDRKSLSVQARAETLLRPS